MDFAGSQSFNIDISKPFEEVHRLQAGIRKCCLLFRVGTYLCSSVHRIDISVYLVRISDVSSMGPMGLDTHKSTNHASPNTIVTDLAKDYPGAQSRVDYIRRFPFSAITIN